MQDVIFIHPPSHLNINQKLLPTPITDYIPSTFAYELYPIGFLSLFKKLHTANFKVKVINLAYLLLREPTLNVPKLIQKLRARCFAIDLHWLVTANGALSLAKLIKAIKPQATILLAGFSATYFYKEILQDYPYIDFIILGDCAEDSIVSLVNMLKEKLPIEKVPNLAYRTEKSICTTTITTTSEGDYDYKYFIENASILTCIPYLVFLRYPIFCVPTVRGCSYECIFCGGSAYAMQRLSGRTTPIYRDPETIAQEVRAIQHYFRTVVFILGDLLQGGYARAVNIVDKLSKIDLPYIFEFFKPPEYEFLKLLSKKIKKFSLQISVESDDDEVRAIIKRPYSTVSFERMLDQVQQLGIPRCDVFFTIGFPKQSKNSIYRMFGYIDSLLKEYGKRGVHVYCSGLLPFLDPASEAFETPEHFGYKLFYKTLNEHLNALNKGDWQSCVSYQTQWLSREDILHLTLEAAYELTKMKCKYRIIKNRYAKVVLRSLNDQMNLLDNKIPNNGKIKMYHAKHEILSISLAALPFKLNLLHLPELLIKKIVL